MGLFSFFFGHDDHHLDDHGRQAAIDAATRAARSLDIEVAIKAHENWKLRLDACLHGTSSEKLDAAHVCDDHACDLGKWIYGDGQQHLGSYATFTELRANHKMFHYTASSVVTLVQAGRKDEAEQLLHGDFEKLSRHVCQRLSDLKALG